MAIILKNVDLRLIAETMIVNIPIEKCGTPIQNAVFKSTQCPNKNPHHKLLCNFMGYDIYGPKNPGLCPCGCGLYNLENKEQELDNKEKKE